MITSFTPVDVHHTTLHTAAAGLISLPIAAAPHHHTAQHRRSLLTAGAGAGCCWWLLLVGVGCCCCCVGKLVAAAALRSARANTLLSPTRPHQGWPVPATTPTNTQQHSTTLNSSHNTPTAAGATAVPALVLHPGLCVHLWLVRVLAIPGQAGRAGCWWHWRDHCSHLGSGATLQHAACSMGTCGDMCGWRVVTLGTGHRRWWLESPSVGGSRARPVDNGLVVVGQLRN